MVAVPPIPTSSLGTQARVSLTSVLKCLSGNKYVSEHVTRFQMVFVLNVTTEGQFSLQVFTCISVTYTHDLCLKL